MPESIETEAPKSFTDLDLQPEVLAALEGMGYKFMTPIQQMAMPHLLQGTDFLGQAPTGTGKTAAFGIPMINRIEPGQQFVQALIIGPTRELAQQISEELNAIGAVKGIKTLAVYGGESVFLQKDKLRQRDIDIVVGTPGRLLDHIGQLSLDLSRCRIAVLDEADEMLDMGFIQDIEDILKHLPGGRENWLFSATISKEIRRIAERYMYFPAEVRIQPQAHSAANIEQFYYIVPEDDKPGLLKHLMDTNPDLYGIVFCQTKREAFLLARQFRDKYPLDCLHGAMPQYERDKVMEQFRQGELRLLVSTDVVARGIDIDSLTHIINYNPPRDPESYIHRIGRTARKGETGIAITFFSPEDGEDFQRLEKRVGMALTRHPDSQHEFGASRPRSRYGNSSGGRSSGGSGGGRSFGGGGRGPRPPQSHGQHQAPRPPQAGGASDNPDQPKRPRRRRRGPGGGGGGAQGPSPSTQSPIS